MEEILVLKRNNAVVGVFNKLEEALANSLPGMIFETIKVGDEASCQVGCNFYPRIITAINKVGRYWTLDVAHAEMGGDKWRVSEGKRAYKETYVMNGNGYWREKGRRCSSLSLGACRSEQFDD